MKKLLIVTGPQGSGNHLFSRLLSLHPAVEGWTEMLDQYWVPSDQEPFAEYWVTPELLTQEVFDNKDFYFANVSCPFFFDGVRNIPKILEVAERARSFGVEVEIAIVVRDQNINQLQQLRVRKEHTPPPCATGAAIRGQTPWPASGNGTAPTSPASRPARWHPTLWRLSRWSARGMAQRTKPAS